MYISLLYSSFKVTKCGRQVGQLSLILSGNCKFSTPRKNYAQITPPPPPSRHLTYIECILRDFNYLLKRATLKPHQL